MECGKVRASVTGGRGKIEELLERSERGVLEVSTLKTQAVFFWSSHNSGPSSAIIFKIFCWGTVKLLYHNFLEAGIIKIMIINCLTDFPCHMTSRRAGFGDGALTLASDQAQHSDSWMWVSDHSWNSCLNLSLLLGEMDMRVCSVRGCKS